MFDPKQHYQATYNPFGIFQGNVPRTFQTALPVGMVPDLNYPFNANQMQSGTPFTSEIDMQNGVIYTGILEFPSSFVTAQLITTRGYRLGLDIKDRGIPKFFIGDKNNFLFWNGSQLTINGQLVSIGFNNNIEFRDGNNVFEGRMFGTINPTPSIVLQGNNDLYLRANNLVGIQGGANVSLGITGVGTFLVVSQLLDSIFLLKPFILAQLAADPAGINGMMYYNTATNKFRVFENSAWVNMI